MKSIKVLLLLLFISIFTLTNAAPLPKGGSVRFDCYVDVSNPPGKKWIGGATWRCKNDNGCSDIVQEAAHMEFCNFLAGRSTYRANTTDQIEQTNNGGDFQDVVLSFNTIAENGNLTIEWATMFEDSIKYFVLEESTDSFNWSVVTNINGQGFSNTPIVYTYLADIPQITTYYRIKYQNVDEEVIYQPVVSTYFVEPETIATTISKNGKIFNSINFFPNPTTNLINIELSYKENFTVSTFDILGKELSSSTYFNTNKIQIDLSSFNNGYYIIRVKTNDEITSHKILKNN